MASSQPRDQTHVSHIAGGFFYQLSHHFLSFSSSLCSFLPSWFPYFLFFSKFTLIILLSCLGFLPLILMVSTGIAFPEFFLHSVNPVYPTSCAIQQEGQWSYWHIFGHVSRPESMPLNSLNHLLTNSHSKSSALCHSICCLLQSRKYLDHSSLCLISSVWPCVHPLGLGRHFGFSGFYPYY